MKERKESIEGTKYVEIYINLDKNHVRSFCYFQNFYYKISLKIHLMSRHHYPCKQELNILGTYTLLNRCGINNICGDGLKWRIGAASIRMAVLTNYTYLMTSFLLLFQCLYHHYINVQHFRSMMMESLLVRQYDQ